MYLNSIQGPSTMVSSDHSTGACPTKQQLLCATCIRPIIEQVDDIVLVYNKPYSLTSSNNSWFDIVHSALADSRK